MVRVKSRERRKLSTAKQLPLQLAHSIGPYSVEGFDTTRMARVCMTRLSRTERCLRSDMSCGALSLAISLTRPADCVFSNLHTSGPRIAQSHVHSLCSRHSTPRAACNNAQCAAIRGQDSTLVAATQQFLRRQHLLGARVHKDQNQRSRAELFNKQIQATLRGRSCRSMA